MDSKCFTLVLCQSTMAMCNFVFLRIIFALHFLAAMFIVNKVVY